MKHPTNSKLPQIPNKRYFTIGEVGHLCCVKPHVLRYWEQEFPQLRPAKRRGNRRYYQREDVVMVRNIRSLLYDEGYTISGARIQLDVVVKQQKQELKAEQKAKTVNNAYTFNFTVATEAAAELDNTPSHTAAETSFVVEPIIEAVEIISPTQKQESLSESSHSNYSISVPQADHRYKNYRLALDETILELKEILAEIQA